MTSGTNGIDGAVAKRFIGEIERCHEELLTERGSYMARCKNIRERIKSWKDLAHDAGIARKALNTYLKERELLAKIDALTEDFEDDEIEQVDLLKAALGEFGDTPLGSAAVQKAEARKDKASKSLDSLTDDDDRDLRPRHLQDKGGDDAAAANAKALKKGIKQLDADTKH